MLRLLASVTVYCFRGGTFSENFKLVRESGLTTRLARKTRFKWRAHWQKVFAALPVLPLFRLREARMRCPVGIGRKPTRGSLRGKAKDRALDGLFLAEVEKNRKKSEKVGKYRKRLEKDRRL